MADIIQRLNGIPFPLKTAFDFGFLQKYGTVFRVFDDQDSGNICFGTKKNGERYFLKFAGAPTAEYDGTAESAVLRLKAALPVYEALRHPNLVEYLGCEEIGGGFLAVFRWTDARCMGRMYPEDRAAFFSLPLRKRVQVFEEILDFLAHTAAKGWLAVDFYDGSIMYDFAAEKTIICDIDFFRPLPGVNDMGRIWGSGKFMSPEEFTLGAALDEVTNVYTAGAMAFALFSDFDRSPAVWPLSEAAYRAVSRAIHRDRAKRQQSIRELMMEWKDASYV